MSGYWDAYAKLDGYWPLQEASGAVAVDAIGSSDGAMEGGLDPALHSVTGPTGWLPNALRFDGASRLVRVPYDSVLFDDQQYALVGWVQLSDPSSVIEAPFGALDIYSMSGCFAHKSIDGNWVHTHGTGSSSPHDVGGTAAPGAWQHLAIVRDADGEKISYLNGVKAVVPLASAFSHNTSAPFTMGGLDLGFGPYYFFDGDIAGVGLATVGLTENEIAELFAGPEPTNAAPPTLSAPAIAGESVILSPGAWDHHGNGAPTTTHELQQSEDGVGGWTTVAGSENAVEVALSVGMAGKYLRVRAVANSEGGESDAASSAVVRVDPPRRPLRIEASGHGVHGAAGGQATSDGAAAGLALTY